MHYNKGVWRVETKLSAGGSLPVYRCADRWICFLSSKPGKFRDNRGGLVRYPQNEIYEAPVILWGTPPKKIFLRLRRACFDPYFYLYFTFVFTIICTFKKKFFFACGGLVFTLSLPLFLPLFLTVFYLLFYPCWTFIFALFLPLFLPSKKISSPAAGLFWSLFLPLFYFCFYHYSKKSSPAAGLFLRLVYLCFYLCFWFYVYLVFYPCLTLVFSFILLLCLPWFCFLPSIVSYQGTETFACRRNQLLLAAARRLCLVSYQALLLTKQPRRSLAAGTSSCSRSGRSRTSSCSRPSLLLTGLDASRLGK